MNDFWQDEYPLGNKKVRGRFVIPSGIRCTHASTIARCFAEIDPIGVITTKSTSEQAVSGNQEPIYARISEHPPHSYINAVGLSNSGAEPFKSEIQSIAVPHNKFLLVSIFGKILDEFQIVDEFVAAALILKPIADGFELNMSCPHSDVSGYEIGQNISAVIQITASVARETNLPVFVKLSRSIKNIAQMARALIDVGATGITLINTIGPATHMVGSHNALHSDTGGLSGEFIRPLSLSAVASVYHEINRKALDRDRKTVDTVRSGLDKTGKHPIIIAMGGISTAEHVRQFREAGADLFGIGSALTGLDSPNMKNYFESLESELKREPEEDSAPKRFEMPSINMKPAKCRVVAREPYNSRLFKLVLDALPDVDTPGDLAGRFYFLWDPELRRAKPFAIFSVAEKSVIVRSVGEFTGHLADMEIPRDLYLYGPYGKPFSGDFHGREFILVGGGTGIASLLEIAIKLKESNSVRFVLGGRSSSDLFDLDKFRQLGPVEVSTNDGSEGHHGNVTDLLSSLLNDPAWRPEPERMIFVNCGPEQMVRACFTVEQPFAEIGDIWGSIEYITSCGVGICGKCASPSGSLTCIDGPFMTMDEFQPIRIAGCSRING
ncbi:MAG: hypothetical protein IT210_16795 [Armatimonadetes bacterium]|nr:hypothetical protein [Armatimonadota bacterium]